MTVIRLPAIYAMVLLGPAFGAEVSVTAGVFRFQATDYYYPNFYTEAGLRGEITLVAGTRFQQVVRLIAYGYPMDDNIFEPSAEYGFRPALTGSGWSVLAEPVAGFGVSKFQYPAPYYPTVTHEFASWLRLGGDVGLGRRLVGPLSFRGAYRGRALIYLGEQFFRNAERNVRRLRYVHCPWAELNVYVGPRWALLARGGVEFGGYYDERYVTPPVLPHDRPFVETGVKYSF